MSYNGFGNVGRRYWIDIGALPETYNWARSADTTELAGAVSSASERSAAFVASGGSFTAATLAAQLHTHLARKLSRAMTPLEAVALRHWRELGAFVLTAGGGNPDILGVFDFLAAAEPATLAVVCSKVGSKLAKKCEQFTHVYLSEAEPPIGKDCFLATNSLL